MSSLIYSVGIIATQFYLYGKKHCTKTGWEASRKLYKQPDILDDETLDLNNKTFMITGANSGIGKEMSRLVIIDVETPRRGQLTRYCSLTEC